MHSLHGRGQHPHASQHEHFSASICLSERGLGPRLGGTAAWLRARTCFAWALVLQVSMEEVMAEQAAARAEVEAGQEAFRTALEQSVKTYAGTRASGEGEGEAKGEGEGGSGAGKDTEAAASKEHGSTSGSADKPSGDADGPKDK